MRGLFLAGAIGLMPLAGAAAADPPAQGAADQDTQRLNEQTAERLRLQREEAQRIETRNRETRERIRLENERTQREYQERVQAIERANAEERARYEAEMARFRAEQADYERQRAARGGRSSGNERRASGNERRADRPAETSRARRSEATAGTCQDQQQRARRRGRAVGGVLGGVAGVVGGRNLGTAARIGVGIAAVPVGALLGEAIASLLDCREQQQAAVATEQAVEAGVGRQVAWRSETRENVSGSSTVTALSTSSVADPNACMTVTDVIIIDGEETRAEKRLCRRPPTNRFVRV